MNRSSDPRSDLRPDRTETKLMVRTVLRPDHLASTDKKQHIYFRPKTAKTEETVSHRQNNNVKEVGTPSVQSTADPAAPPPCSTPQWTLTLIDLHLLDHATISQSVENELVLGYSAVTRFASVSVLQKPGRRIQAFAASSSQN